MTTKEMIDAFHAKGGAVQVLADSASNGMSARDWKDAVSDRGFSPANSTQRDDDSEAREERHRERVNDAYMSGGIDARDYEMSRGR